MQKTSVALCLCLCAALGACKKQPPAKPAAPAGSALVRRPTPVPAPVPGVSPEEAKTLLTDEKITRFATYLKEISDPTAPAASPARAEPQKVGTEPGKLPDTVATNRPAQGADQAAIAKSGLTEQEVAKLNRVLRPYYRRLYLMQRPGEGLEEARARVAKAKNKGKAPDSADVGLVFAHDLQVKLAKEMRDDFAKRYGQAAYDAAKKHEQEFFGIGVMRKP